MVLSPSWCAGVPVDNKPFAFSFFEDCGTQTAAVEVSADSFARDRIFERPHAVVPETFIFGSTMTYLRFVNSFISGARWLLR